MVIFAPQIVTVWADGNVIVNNGHNADSGNERKRQITQFSDQSSVFQI